MGIDQRVDALDAWNEFATTVADIAQVLRADDLIEDDQDVADALGFLGRLTRFATASLDPADNPAKPSFSPFGPPETSFGIPNPDNVYQVCSVHPDNEYVIRGRRNTVHFFSMGAQAPGRAAVPGTPSHLGDDRLILDAKGAFEIAVSREPRAGNWIQLQQDSRTLMVRQTHLRRGGEVPAELEIRRIGGPERSVSPALVSRLRRMKGATESLRMLSAVWPDWVRGFTDHAAVNEFHILDEAAHLAIGGDPEVRTPLCRWAFQPGEALLLEVTPPECTYWNVQLATLWTEPITTTSGVSWRNNASIDLSEDGVARLVISAEDAHVSNWLDTGGRRHGTMVVRWVGARNYPLPSVKVIPLERIRREASV
jgi:hypothetical protein